MRRTIAMLAFVLVVGLFGLVWGAAPGHAQGVCTLTPGTNKYTCSQTDWTHMPFGGMSGVDITVTNGARIGSLWGFASSSIFVQEGAEAFYDGYPAIWSTGPDGVQLSNNSVINRGKVAGITLYGNDNFIQNYGTIDGPGVYISGTDSELRNQTASAGPGTIQAATAVQADNLGSMYNSGHIISTRNYAINIQGSAAGTTEITNTGRIQAPDWANAGIAIYRGSGHNRSVKVENQAAGNVFGAINLAGNGNDTVDNKGVIHGYVQMSGGNNTLWNRTGATMHRNVVLGTGNDIVTNEEGATIGGNVQLGDGVDKLTNSGTIEGYVAANAGKSDITNEGSIDRLILGAGDDTVTNVADAVIGGNAQLGGGNDVLTNLGRIEGIVTSSGGTSNITNENYIGGARLGGGHDTVTNTADAIIDGDVGLGGGNDVLKNSGRIEGTVTAGAGTSDITNKNFIADIDLGEGDDTVTNTADAIIDGDVGLGGGNDKLKNFGRIEGAVTAGAGTSEITNENFVADIDLGDGDDTVTNTADAIIDGNVGLGGGNDVLKNSGRIEGTVTAGTGTSDITNENFIASIDLGDGDDTVTNVAGAIISGDVSMGDGTDEVTNLGTISGGVNLGGGDAATDSNTLTNSGTIAQGVIGGDIKNTVTNEDGGKIVGGVTLGDGDDTVTNVAGATIDGNVGLGGGNDKLNNFGRIEGTVTAGTGTSDITNDGFVDRIRLGAGNDTVTNTNTGSIDGNVDLGSGDNVLSSSGTIGGNVITGTGFDQVDIQGSLRGSVSGGSGVDHVTVGSDAQVLGSVLLGAGDDKLILQNWDGSQILGTMDGGDGDDRLILEGGKGALLTFEFRNFENVTVRNEGEWTISGSIPTSGGALTTSALAGLWLEGDGNAVTYAADGKIVVEADGGTGVFVEGDKNAFTNDGTIDVDGERASGIHVQGNENILVNTASGAITATTQSDTVTGVGIIGSDNEFTNDGAIDVSETSARGINVWGSENTVTNTEGASIVADGDGAVGVVLAGADNKVANEGRIEANGDGGFGVGVAGSGNNVTNTAAGTIVAQGDDAMGILVDGADNGIENAGTIEVEGKEVVGVHIEGADNTFDNAGTVEGRGTGKVTGVQVVSTDDSADANVITNTGTIRAESDSGEARGIVTTGAGKTQIHNELGALIEADIAIHAGGEGEYGITNDGTIRGDIVLGDGDHVVQNDGDIFGDIRLGDGNHDITNDGFLSGNIDLSQSVGDHKVQLVGGSLWDPGLIQLGTGDDVLTYSTVANDMTAGHTLDGGDGDDTLILVDDGYLNLYNIVNFETLELRDAGTWQFHRDVSFRDAVTADAGHLILGNATEGGIEFGTGGLTIGSDARLSGTGTITGDVTIEGTVAPGHSFGVLNVAGNYTQAAGSTYEAEMAIDGRRDLIHAAGAATIANDTLLDITAEYGYYDPTHRWNVLKADGGVTGTYAKAEWDIDLLFLGPGATTEGDNVYIDLVHAGPSFESVAGTPNQKAVAAALDAAEAAGVGMGVVNMVLPALDIADARQAYDSLHGEIYAQHRWVTLGSTQDFVAAANKGIDSNGGARSVWGSVHKGTGKIESQGAYMGVEHDHLGLVVGWTAWANDTWGLGLLGGMSNVNVAVADAASAGTGQGQKFGAYARYDNGRFGATAQVVSGQDRFAVDRDLELLGNPLDDQKAKAEYDGSNLAVSLEGSLNYKLGDYELKPMLAVNLFSVSRAAFTETGAGAANLAVKADEYSVTQGALGLTVTAPVPEGQTYTPQFRVAYVTNFGGFASEFDAAFAVAKDVPFTIGGETPADGGFIAGASIRGETGKAGLSYELSYDGKFFGPATVHTIGGGLGYSF